MPWIRDAAPRDPGCAWDSLAVISADRPPIAAKATPVQHNPLVPLKRPDVGLLAGQVAIIADLGPQLRQSARRQIGATRGKQP